MAAQNPMDGSLNEAFPNLPRPVSKQVFTVAGITIAVYGLNELISSAREVACLWLLHPRLQTQACMEPLAAAAVSGWNERKESETMGLLAITFDQHGTASDTSLLMTYLSSYIFPSSDRAIVTNVVLGVSLGGHAAWQCLVHDMRISAAIIVIGCPDYFSLMSDRARLSKLESWVDSPTPGTHFLGSKDFPAGLVTAVELHDPAAMLLGKLDGPIRQVDEASPSPVEQARLLPLMKRLFQGKRILNLSGRTDKLVPYRCGEGFIKWLKAAAAPGGWFEGGIHVKDILFDNVGHQMSPEMVVEAVQFEYDAHEL
ncbi:MAG: hypothetical protein L6R35_003058 [Caloplaca aegaea]|nr:MAG: hypothetical protein L6R35_003058 [Caloplaca aegaea]